MFGRATPGITIPSFSECPLGTEGEMTAGADDWNPYDDPEVPPRDYPLYEGERPAMPPVEPPERFGRRPPRF